MKPDKLKLRVYCYSCKSESETDCVVNCNVCGNSSNIGVEPDLEMHKLCRLWALFHGFEDRINPFSLPQFFQKTPSLLEEWKKFKHRLLTPALIPLPPQDRNRERFEDQRLFSSTTEAYHHFWCYCGILSLHSGQSHEYGVGGMAWMVTEPIVQSFRRDYPFLERAAIEFVEYCKEKGFVQ
jgi:hypothetical protein